MNDYKAVKDMLSTIKIKDVMTSPAITVKVEEDFSVVEEIFVNKDIRHLPVVNEQNEIVGVISQKDVYRRISPRRTFDGNVIYGEGIIIDKDGYYEKDSLNKYILNYAMSKNPVFLSEANTLGDAIHAMSAYSVSCVPIVDEKKHVVGIITRIDIINFADKIYSS